MGVQKNRCPYCGRQTCEYTAKGWFQAAGEGAIGSVVGIFLGGSVGAAKKVANLMKAEIRCTSCGRTFYASEEN